MAELFQEPVGTDELYNRIINAPPHDPWQLSEARAFSERLWAITAPYLDRDLPKKLTQHFHQSFWEMYLAAALLDAGVPLMPRDPRKRSNYGPDLHISPNIWVEAIAVTPGSGDDAVPDHPADHQAYQVPDKEMRLRLLAGVIDKRKKFEAYCAKGFVSPSDICIVAVNGGWLGTGPDFEPPRIIRALFEIGWPTLTIDLDTRKVVDSGHSHQPHVSKRSGSTVSQGMFRDDSCTSIAAVIYSNACYASSRDQPGCDFLTVHNPTATVALERSSIRFGTEYWQDGDNLTKKIHSAC